MLSAAAANAQQGAVPQPTCAQKMIEGIWQAQIIPTSLLCTVRIDSRGDLSSTACSLGMPAVSLKKKPEGTLTIDRYCAVTGDVRHVICGTEVAYCQTYVNSLNLWRSGDGTRLTGYTKVVITTTQPSEPPVKSKLVGASELVYRWK
jgi:hypothetical protein